MVTLKGHSDIVMGMMVMRSLDNLVSASLDTSIRVWDTYTQKPVHTLLGHNKVRLHTAGKNRVWRQASRGTNTFMSDIVPSLLVVIEASSIARSTQKASVKR